jgi:hypothetical protein
MLVLALRRDFALLAATQNNELKGAPTKESTMTKHVPATVPAVPGINLSFRPRTYFGPVPLETHLLSRVAGQERREALRRELAVGNLDLPDELVACLLDEDARNAIGRIHPAFMGGEYLPPLLDDEVEIARVSLASVTADQISVRAQRVAGGIAYRIVDEYAEDGPGYVCRPNLSQVPLTLGELVAMIDGAQEGGGAAMSALISNVESGADLPRAYRDFVRVSSEFYRQLGAYYEAKIEAWFDANYPLEAETGEAE